MQMPGVFRPAPMLPAGSMQTYRILAPMRTHWRPATCEEVDCPHFLHGWAVSVMPESADDAAVRGSGRSWSKRETTPEGFIRYEFPPGQACFKAGTHRVRLEREEIYLKQGGDWRGNPRGIPPQQLSPEAWLSDFGEHQERLADELAHG